MASNPPLLGYTTLLGDPVPKPSRWDRVKQALWETNLAAPFRGAYNLMNTPYEVLNGGPSPELDRAVGDSFDAASGAMIGGSVVPKPANALNMGIKAYHGSPHSFDKFSMDKIGTGEGAQAYGHGLYFAENEGVAKGYRDTLKPGKGTGPEDTASRVLDGHGGDREAAIASLTDTIDRAFANNAPYDEVQRLMQAKNILNTAPEKATGSMYEVSINADPNAFLDWDKPLSEQPESVQKAFGSLVDRDLSKETGWAKLTGERAHNAVVERSGQKGVAEQRFKEAGIPGIKYLDAGSRNNDGWKILGPSETVSGKYVVSQFGGNNAAKFNTEAEAKAFLAQKQAELSRNYVVFDDKLISIVRKYGIAGASAMLGYDVLANANKAQAQELNKANAQYHGTHLGGGGW